MLLSRTFAQRRMTLLALAGALVVCAFVALPEGRAFASALLLLFRGQTLQAVPTDYSHLQNAYATLEELEQLGTLTGTIPTKLNNVSSISAAASMTGFTPAQPANWPAGISHTPAAIKAIGPTQVILTLNKAKADAYFQNQPGYNQGLNPKLPAQLDGEQLIVDFPGVSVLEYTATSGGGRLFVGQAGQLVVNASGNATLSQLRSYLLTLPGLKPETVTALQNISAWQTTIPLGIPTDRVGWSDTSVGGSLGGSGVLLNDNTGVGSAILWQRSNGTQSLGVGGWGLKASDVQSVAGSLH